MGVLNIFVSFGPKSAYPCTVTFLPFGQDKFLDFFRKNSILNIYLQIWFIGRTLASQAGKAGSIPVICLFEISLKVRESQYLSAFPHFSLFPNQKHFCLKMQHALQVQFLNQSILQYL